MFEYCEYTLSYTFDDPTLLVVFKLNNTKMNQLFCRKSKDFSVRKVSIDRTVKVLSQNGIRVNKENAEIILDFLYLIAKTYKQKEDNIHREFEP